MFLENRRITTNFMMLRQQTHTLSKLLKQERLALKELNHRTKNNFQHIISLLEIKKKATGFSNIEELITENQNHVNSIGLLHETLNIPDRTDTVFLKKYMSRLGRLINDSYSLNKKNINLNIVCNVEQLKLDFAQVLGLILVELITNSVKHAFKNNTHPKIEIVINYILESRRYSIEFLDNGIGFDFSKNYRNGCGLYIVKGLLDQLEATYFTNNTSGFSISITF